jgi:hypothetical protein
VAGELVQLDEGTLVEEEFDALTGRQFALGVLLLDGACGAGVRRWRSASFPAVVWMSISSDSDIGMRLPACSKGGTVTHPYSSGGPTDRQCGVYHT